MNSQQALGSSMILQKYLRDTRNSIIIAGYQGASWSFWEDTGTSKRIQEALDSCRSNWIIQENVNRFRMLQKTL